MLGLQTIYCIGQDLSDVVYSLSKLRQYVEWPKMHKTEGTIMHVAKDPIQKTVFPLNPKNPNEISKSVFYRWIKERMQGHNTDESEYPFSLALKRRDGGYRLLKTMKKDRINQLGHQETSPNHSKESEENIRQILALFKPYGQKLKRLNEKDELFDLLKVK